MKINIDQYAANRKFVRNLIERKGVDSYKNVASEFALASSVPVFVVYFYIGEIVGFNDWIVNRMKGISKFYGYTEVICKDTEVDLVQFVKRD